MGPRAADNRRARAHTDFIPIGSRDRLGCPRSWLGTGSKSPTARLGARSPSLTRGSSSAGRPRALAPSRVIRRSPGATPRSRARTRVASTSPTSARPTARSSTARRSRARPGSRPATSSRSASRRSRSAAAPPMPAPRGSASRRPRRPRARPPLPALRPPAPLLPAPLRVPARPRPAERPQAALRRAARRPPRLPLLRRLRPAGQGPGPPPPPGAGRPGPGPGAPPPGGGGGGRRIALIIVGAVVALLVIVGVVLAATGAFSSDEKKPKPPPLTVPSTPNTVPSVPAQSTPTQTTDNTAGKATYIIQFDRIQRSYSKQVARLIKKARNPSSVGDIITAFKRLKTLYGSTATRIGDIETPGEIRPVSRTYTSTLRVSSAGINLIIACARQRSESCYKRRLSSLSSRTRRVRKKFGRDFRARGYPVAVLAPS